jgi:hypothetical protein
MTDKAKESAVTADINIDADAAQVWEVLADYTGMYTWAPSIEETKSVSDAIQGVGAIRRNTATGFGVIDQEVTAWAEGEGFTYIVGAFGPFRRTTTSYRITKSGQHASKCSLKVSFEMQDDAMAGGPAEDQLKEKLGAGSSAILDALKKRVETGTLVRPHKPS